MYDDISHWRTCRIAARPYFVVSALDVICSTSMICDELGMSSRLMLWPSLIFLSTVAAERRMLLCWIIFFMSSDSFWAVIGHSTFGSNSRITSTGFFSAVISSTMSRGPRAFFGM